LKLAVTGKGGVGKTTLVSLLARLYAAEGHPVLAIDADPDANLASALGISADVAALVTPVAELKDLIEERTGAKPGTVGGFFKLNPRVDDIPDRFSVAHAGVKLVVMGSVQAGGAGCVCPESALLKQLVRHLLVRRSEVVIMDMEAGIEHLGRGTAQFVDAMIVVVEPGQRSLRTAATVQRLARDIGVKRCFVVGCKVKGQGDRDFIAGGSGEIPVLGYLSYSPGIIEADLKGLSPYDLDEEAVAETRAIRQTLEGLLRDAEDLPS
jgi:CO dehydrogenase maturation factor